MSQLQSTGNVPSHVPEELVIDFDACNDPGLKFDIFTRINELRASTPPIAYSPYNGGHWMLFRQRDILATLQDSEHFSNRHISAGSVAQGGPEFIPLGMDPPEHGPWRLLLMKYFGPAAVRKFEISTRQKAEELIIALKDAPNCNFVPAVAEPMPISIFMELMGLPYERFPEFRSLAIQILNPDGLYNPANQEAMAIANGKIIAILTELIVARSQNPQDDLVSALIRETVNGQPIGGSELMSICYVLFLGGLDTVTNAMSFGIRYLARNPTLQAEVRKDPSQIPALVDKLLRQSAFINTGRSVKKDVELAGVQMKTGDMVWCMSWAGSNEPGGETEGPRHLAFGAGPHMCAGMHLARLELRIAYETWFKHIGPFSLAPDDGPTMTGGPIMHIKRLLLNLTPLQAA